MSIDPYSSCPGGTGKKIKFCCAELVGDLEQLGEPVPLGFGGDEVARGCADLPARAGGRREHDQCEANEAREAQGHPRG